LYLRYSGDSLVERVAGGGLPGGYVSTSLTSALICRLFSVANSDNFAAEF